MIILLVFDSLNRIERDLFGSCRGIEGKADPQGHLKPVFLKGPIVKLCSNCGQPVAEEIVTCPNCGKEVREGRKTIDDYRIKDVLHEGHSSILCKAFKDDQEDPVMIRIFTQDSGVDETIADRLKSELEKLKQLPEDYFVRHFDIRRSSDGLWYRVSEWVNAINWGTLFSSGYFQDYRKAFDLFYKITSILQGLHQIGHIIPHLILNDIMVYEGENRQLEIKIDFKLSRFLDPQMVRCSSPMLQKLLNCHPDILNGRPLDGRSDIWSLGKIFLELLSGDPELIDFSTKVEELPLPDEMRALIKVMMAEDPDLRPRSMAEVAEILSGIKDKDIKAAELKHVESAPVPIKEVRGIKTKMGLLAAIVLALVVAGGFAYYHFAIRKSGSETVLMDFANQYASSVAFVVVDYWIAYDEGIMYRNRTEGTAFLVNEKGHLLTNRHVACPWLEDNQLFIIVNRLRMLGKSPQLEYRIYLWFEGEKAFKRLPDQISKSDVADIYNIEFAFRSDGFPRLSISGVARLPVKTWQLVKSPLKDDFAVLKIDRVPKGLIPLPLDPNLDVKDIPKLSPVITLGFPLGSRTQAATINVSATRGYVRRAFEDMFQVDTSIHRGNSGGPVVDMRGKVIGIASRVAMDWATSPIPVATPLSDIGMIQPIDKAAAFVLDLESGKVKWNGVLDLSIDQKLKNISDIARQGKWAEAKELADKELKSSMEPRLIMWSGVMHFCSGDDPGAKSLFEQALSMNPENTMARLMLFMIDWQSGRSYDSPHRTYLMALNWRSTDEFLGYWVRLLEKQVTEEAAFKGGYTEDEQGWLYYAAGLLAIQNKDLLKAERFLQKAVLTSDIEGWAFFLALCKLQKVQKDRLLSMESDTKKADHRKAQEAFSIKQQKQYSEKVNEQEKLFPIILKLGQQFENAEEKRNILKQLLKKNYKTGKILPRLIYHSAMAELWSEALVYARQFLGMGGRDNLDRLSIGLLVPQLLDMMGKKDEAGVELKKYHERTRDPWYRSISECIIGEKTEPSLKEKAGTHPENLLTLYMHLGLWAEGSGDREKAIQYYKQALESYMDNRIEYAFAIARINQLKKQS